MRCEKINWNCAQREIRTPTPVKALPPQDSVSTNSTIWAKESDSAGARTQDPLLKRQMLYQLSYRIILLFKEASPKGSTKIERIFSMSNNWMRVFLIFLGFWAALPFQGKSEAGESTQNLLEKADKAYAAGKFDKALQHYDAVYAEDQFTEKMLYQMASIHERKGEYGWAVYYLKKVGQEYGNELLEDKIRELMLDAGSSRTFSSSGYVTFYRLFKSWGTLFWILFFLAALLLAADFLLKSEEKPLWRQIGSGGLWFLFAALLCLHTYNLFYTPDRAVLVAPTSFYQDPGYGADHRSNVFGQGETLNIRGQRDIWLEVEAGGESWWVPKWTLKRL